MRALRLGHQARHGICRARAGHIACAAGVPPCSRRLSGAALAWQTVATPDAPALAGNPAALPSWLLTPSVNKTKTKWRNSAERAADRAARLTALVEKYGVESVAAMQLQGRQRPPPPVRKPKPPAPPRPKAERGPKLRRTLFPTIRASQKCGHCGACLNPSWKKACLTRRHEMEAQAAGDAASPPALDPLPGERADPEEALPRPVAAAKPMHRVPSGMQADDEEWTP